MNLLSMTSMKIYAVVAPPSTGSIPTAIGNIPSNMCDLVSKVAAISVGIAGVIAIGLLAAGGFTLLTSAGNPDKLMSGREIITNALIGLALIILSVFVLELLGWDFLGIGALTGVNFSNICP